jgi:O-antigen/teichoic acid export membrane protein
MLLVPLGTSSSETGIFYIAVMISIAVGGLASSIAMMAIPTSAELKSDLSGGSLRLGISLTTPVIVALLAAPQLVLSVIGNDYVSAYDVLLVLSIGIVPSVIVSNVTSKLNTLGRHKNLLIIGSVQLTSFFVAFFILVPTMGILGAAYSMTISFILSAVPAYIWLESQNRRYILNSILAISAGVGIGFFVSSVAAGIHEIVPMTLAVAISGLLVLKLGNTSIGEIKRLVKTEVRLEQ